MKVINHIAVYSRDPARLERFYRNYFYASRDGGCGGPKTGCQSFFLRFDDEVRLEVIARPVPQPRSPRWGWRTWRSASAAKAKWTA